MTLRLTDFL